MQKGGVLVNDSRNRQLIALDSTFSNFTVALDSAASAEIRYGEKAQPLISYLADSTLFKDATSSYFLVIDPSGNVVHRFIRTKPGDAPLPMTVPRGFDLLGNPIMSGMRELHRAANGKPAFSDDIPIFRMNSAAHANEEITRVLSPALERTQPVRDDKGEMRIKLTLNPLVLTDDWAVLTDGSIAIVRGNGYRVEILQPDGRKIASTKLPFEKRKLSNDDKKALSDSAEAIALGEPENGGESQANSTAAMMSAVVAARQDSSRKAELKATGKFTLNVQPFSGPQPIVEFVPFKEMLDYLPPFRHGAAKADLDNNVWILTTAIGEPGETLYDVVNNRGVYVERVRIPAGRSIVGFGRGGIVYLKFRDGARGWALERVHVM